MTAGNDSPADTIRDYLAAILHGDAAGWLVVAVGSGGHLNEHGKYAHKRWNEFWFQWPDNAAAAITHIEKTAARGDVYVCPYLMCDRKRAKGNAVDRRLVHSDVDNGALDLAEVDRLGGFVIGSGTPGNGHVYIPLKHPVTAAQHELLCKGLAAHLHGDEAKVSDNDLLRPPGTFNHKPTTTGGKPVPVKAVQS